MRLVQVYTEIEKDLNLQLLGPLFWNNVNWGLSIMSYKLNNHTKMFDMKINASLTANGEELDKINMDFHNYFFPYLNYLDKYMTKSYSVITQQLQNLPENSEAIKNEVSEFYSDLLRLISKVSKLCSDEDILRIIVKPHIEQFVFSCCKTRNPRYFSYWL